MTVSAKSGLRSPVLSDTANVPRDIGNLVSDLDGRVTTICTAATRPTTTGLFAGHHIYETDTNLVYVYDGSGWQPVPVGKTHYNVIIESVSMSGGGSLFSLAIPAQKVAHRVAFSIGGTIGFSPAANQRFGIDLAATGGTLQVGSNKSVRCAEAGMFYPYSMNGYVDVAANSALTLAGAFLSVDGSTGYVRAGLNATVQRAGTY